MSGQDFASQIAAEIQTRWPRWLEDRPALALVAAAGGVVLHGSLTRGICDEFADFDLWVIAPATAVAAYDAAADSRFVELPKIDGRPGHAGIESIEAMTARVDACEMAWIDELRLARVIRPERACIELVKRCRRPMPADVRRAMFMHHYVEFRSEDRALDNPLNRRDGAAMLFAAADALEHAMRAALVLEGRTYPYKKWLARAFAECEIAPLIQPHVETLLATLTPQGYALGGPEQKHPASNALRSIRMILIDRAEREGLGGRYLREWWLELTTARAAKDEARWPK